MLKFNSNNTFITGCSHFGHANIIKYCNRPFDSVELMNKVLWDGIKSLPENSVLIHLGDFSFGGNKVIEDNWQKFYDLIKDKRIDCHFIFGNHDKHIRRMYIGYDNRDFFSFYDTLEFTMDNMKDFIVASHYPMEDWHGKLFCRANYNTLTGGSYHIHCHTHRELETSKGIRRIHGGVDTIGYEPVLVKEILRKIL